MREILFRGKVTDGNWIYGNYIYAPNNMEIHSICDPNFPYDWYEIDQYTLGQYTGLVDRNNKRVFEGDICKFREWENGEMIWIGMVRYEHQQFIISGGPNKECQTPFYLPMSRFISRNIEVIGNIHDNSELMKRGMYND